MAMEITFADVIQKKAKVVMHIHRRLFTTAMISMNAKLIPVHVHGIHCAWINKVAMNVNVRMVSRVMNVSTLTNVVTNVSTHPKDIQIHVMIVLSIRLVPICLVHFDVAVTQVTNSQVIQLVLTTMNVTKLLVILVPPVTTPWDRLHVNVTLVSAVMVLTYVLISMSVMKVSMSAQKHQNASTILVIIDANVIMDMMVKTAQVELRQLLRSLPLV